MKTRIKTKRLVALLLCCVMALVMLPVTALAATADETPMPFSFKVDKTVVKGGDAVPGQETFTFELVYGAIVENTQMPRPLQITSGCDTSARNSPRRQNGARPIAAKASV